MEQAESAPGETEEKSIALNLSILCAFVELFKFEVLPKRKNYGITISIKALWPLLLPMVEAT
jgi:hypothetical protein